MISVLLAVQARAAAPITNRVEVFRSGPATTNAAAVFSTDSVTLISDQEYTPSTPVTLVDDTNVEVGKYYTYWVRCTQRTQASWANPLSAGVSITCSLPAKSIKGQLSRVHYEVTNNRSLARDLRVQLWEQDAFSNNDAVTAADWVFTNVPAGKTVTKDLWVDLNGFDFDGDAEFFAVAGAPGDTEGFLSNLDNVASTRGGPNVLFPNLTWPGWGQWRAWAAKRKTQRFSRWRQ